VSGRRELTEPWGIVSAGVLGGLAWAVTAVGSLPVGAGLGVGAGVAAAVYGAKVGSAVLLRRGREAERARPARPRRGTPADVWLDRAERTVRTLHDQTAAAADGATREQVSGIGDEAAATLDSMRRLGAQVAAVESALSRIDVPRLQADSHRLGAELATAGGAEARADRERAHATVEEQIGVAGRLASTRDTLLTRMQATTLGLEGLVARLAEVLALSATAGGIDITAERISGLTDELEGLRAGLAETEALSRRVLGG
jgi:hypothetical protein